MREEVKWKDKNGGKIIHRVREAGRCNKREREETRYREGEWDTQKKKYKEKEREDDIEKGNIERKMQRERLSIKIEK